MATNRGLVKVTNRGLVKVRRKEKKKKIIYIHLKESISGCRWVGPPCEAR